MKNLLPLCVAAALLPLNALAQVQKQAGQVPVGEGRLPTESAAPVLPRAGGDDCKRQAQVVREQFALQEQALRREMTERGKQAGDADRERLRAETEQRLAALRAEATQAERRVKETCSG